jgi:Icc-related predicted phosphoesterase
MRLLLFSDLHTNAAAAERLVRMAEGADVAIGAGDFASVRRGTSTCINILRQIRIPSVLVPGNNETYDELREACAGWPGASVLHGTGVDIAGVPFFGLGGGVPVTPFGNWSFDFSEADATRLLSGCPAGAVLVSHSPPKGAVDVASGGRSLGSTAVREAVVRLKPRLVVCGHIHDSAGQRTMIGNSPVINAGPAGILYELDAGASP